MRHIDPKRSKTKMRTIMKDQELTAEQSAMVRIWEKHMAAEFKTKSVDDTMATMTSDPLVNHVPAMTGGVG